MARRTVMSLLVLALLAALPAGMAFAGEAKKIIRISNGVNDVHPAVLGAKKFKEVVESKVGARYEIQVYANAQLGDDVRATESVRAGTLEMVIPSTSPLTGLSKELMVFDLPFLFPNSQVATKVLYGPVGQRILDSMSSKGLKGLAYWENGFRQLSNSVREVKSPADIKGLKIRTMENPLHLAAWKALGANPTPMPFSEVFTAMQQKTIDGQENPVVVIYLQKFNEVQKYVTLTGHIYTPFLLLMNQKLWDGMSAEDQKAFMDGAIAGRDYVLQLNKEMTDTQIKKLREFGMTVTELTPQQLKVFQDAVQTVYTQFEDRIGKSLVDEIRAEVKKASN